MSLQRVQARGDDIGRAAAAAAIQRIASLANLPADVTIEAGSEKVTVTGKRLRRRFIADPALRNFAHE